MGNAESKKEKEEVEKGSDSLQKWRDDGFESWNETTTLRLREDIIKRIKVVEQTKPIDILVCGGTGQGKSSFINNCLAAISGKLFFVARAGSAAEHLTTKYQRFQSCTNQDEPVTKLPLWFCDTKGFNKGKSGVSVEAIKACILGKVKNGEEIDQKADDKWKGREPIRNKVSYILFVADANYVPNKLDKSSPFISRYKKLRELRDFSIEAEIKVAGILTHCDKLDPAVERDVSNLHYSTAVMKKIKTFGKLFEIPLNRVFPVKNYTEEVKISNGMMIQTLIALKGCLDDIEGEVICAEK